MELPKSVDLEESPETKQVEFVDLEKGQGCEMEEEEAGAKNQTLFNVISLFFMVMILPVYISLVTYCSKNMPIWPAIGTAIIITPAYLLMLKTTSYLRDTYVKNFAMYPASGGDVSNLASGNA
uniref:Uncharacterized protein n=1 Tax=Oryza rufipogon TaxID=4529 RepID=A0A0E0NES1_ORYRU